MRTLKTIKAGLELLDDRRSAAAAAATAASSAVMDNDGQGDLDEYDQTGAGQTVRG
jgi:hypothetical protein